MKKILLMLFLFHVSLLHASKNAEEFGFLNQSHLDLKKCEYDPEAEAVVVFDKAYTRFVNTDEGYNIVTERTVRIKVLTDDGVKWGEIDIPFYMSNDVFEKISNIQAFSYNFDNTGLVKTALRKEDCHEERVSENWYRIKFAIPNVRAGSLIEYTYSYLSNYLFNLNDWEFQWKIPVLKSEYSVGMVPHYQYQYMLQGAKKFDVFQNGTDGFERTVYGIKFMDNNFIFGMNNVPAFKDETFISSVRDYIMKIDFQLSKVIRSDGAATDVISTWPMLVKEMLEDSDFGGFARSAQKSADKIFDIDSVSKLPVQQRFDSIVNFVKQQFKWNDEFRMRTKKSQKELLKSRTGNSAEINLLTIGLLNAAGIKANPVLVSTRNHGKVKMDYPFLNSFNSVVIVAELENGPVLTDATDNLIKHNTIQLDCVNGSGLVIQKSESVSWLNLNPRGLSRTKTSIISEIVGRTMISNIVINATDYDGVQLRKQYGENKEKLTKHILEENETLTDGSLQIKNMSNAKSPYVLYYQVSNLVGGTDDKLYFSPLLKEAPYTQPFKQQIRTYPIDMIYPHLRSFVCTVKIPSGYEVEFLPDNKKFSTDELELDYQISNVEDKVLVSLMYAFKKPVFQAEEYEKIRKFYQDLIAKGSEQVVLRRK
jgi:hypothetical protein